MRRYSGSAIMAALAGVLWPLIGEGAILTYATQGRVTQITDPLGLLDFVQVDDIVTYRGTFDTSQGGSHPFPGFSTYTGQSSHMQVGAMEFAGEPPIMAIAHPGDLVDMESDFTVVLPGVLPQGSVRFVLNDQAQSNALADTALPTVPYDLSLFASSYQKISFWAPPQTPGGYEVILWVGASVDSFEVIPEPGSLLLMGLGGLLLIGKHSC